MKKTFTLRVDVESSKGIEEGLPKLLDLLKKYEVKCSFYLVMGGESNAFELIRHRRGSGEMGERSIKVFSALEKARIAFLPQDFVKNNKKILMRILEDGHELGIHGWKHREWTRGLDSINIDKSVKKAIYRYKKIFGRDPISFAAPGFNTNEKVLRVLEQNHILFISDFGGEKPKFYGSIKNVPITIKGDKNTPIIEFLAARGKTDKDIFEYIKSEFSKHDIISFYIHDLYEARVKLNLIENLLRLVKNKRVAVKRIIDY